MLAEIILRRGLDAVDLAAEGEAVEIFLQDPVLAVKLFQSSRFEDLSDFPEQGPARSGLGHAGQLHGDGRGAGNDASVGQILPDRAEERGEIDPVMMIKIAVLGGEYGPDHFRRDLIEFHLETPLCVIRAADMQDPPVPVGPDPDRRLTLQLGHGVGHQTRQQKIRGGGQQKSG